MLKAHIGTTDLTGKIGSVELPEEIVLCCPICKIPVSDKGQCFVNFVKVYSRTSATGFAVGIAIDCRNCGKQDLPPAIEV